MTGLVLWGVAPPDQPESAGNTPSVEVPVPVNPQPEPTAPPPEPKPEPSVPRGGGGGGKKNETPKPSPVVPPGPKPEPPAPIVVTTPGGQQATCQVIPPDRPPNVTLRAGEIVFAAESGLLRLDRELKTQRILIADELMNVRSIAVEVSGTILVGTTVCGAGALVRVDPQTGRMEVVASGFKTPKAMLFEPFGTLLVADEIGGSPAWGYLWRLNLQTGEKASIYAFPPSEVATGMAVDPKTGEIFFTRRGLYRLSRDGVTRISVEGVLSPTSTTLFRGNLLVTAEGPPMMEIRTNGETVRMIEGGGAISDLVARGNDAFVGYANGRVGIIREGTAFATNVWQGMPSGQGVFVAVVPENIARR